MKKHLSSLLKSIPPIRRILQERDELRRRCRQLEQEIEQRYRPGHFSSPIPSQQEIADNADRIFDLSYRDLPGVNLNARGQLAILDQLKDYYSEVPFQDEPVGEMRYGFNNSYYGHGDAIFLFCLLRLLQPKRIIEIGSGYSSFVMLDTSELFFDNQIHLTFIEPNDERLRSRLKERDLESVSIHSCPVQDTPLNLFAELQGGDILFVDSSHVARVGSDVNFILFEIVPRLAVGTYIHFHDIFYPFEYPKELIDANWFWSENYILRAFLEFNSAFEVVVWNQFLALFHEDVLREKMPLCLKNSGAGIWLKRVS